MMHPTHFLIIDDSDPKPVVELLSKAYPNAETQRIREKEAIREHLQHCSYEDTLILVNAHIRFNEGDIRSNFRGMRFLRKELRTRWRRREAVIVYSPLSPEIFKGIPINRILYAEVGHYYYHIIRLKSIIDIVENAKPIKTEDQLDGIIQDYGCVASLIRTFKHGIENKLPVNVSGRYSVPHRRTLAQLERIVQDLEFLLPRRFHQAFQIKRLKEDIQKLIDEIQQGSESEFDTHATQIRSILSSYKELCDQFFGAR
jgi:hypothetical protein